MNTKIIIQHLVSVLIFLTGIIFALLKIFGVVIIVNEADINSLIFGLGSLTAAGVELVPFIIITIKDKNLIKIMQIVKVVVDAIEELKGLSSATKKSRAMEIIKNECYEQGLTIDMVTISNLIETAVAIRNKVVKV